MVCKWSVSRVVGQKVIVPLLPPVLNGLKILPTIIIIIIIIIVFRA